MGFRARSTRTAATGSHAPDLEQPWTFGREQQPRKAPYLRLCATEEAALEDRDVGKPGQASSSNPSPHREKESKVIIL